MENACFLMISEYNELYLLDKFSVYYQLLDTYLRYPAIVGREGILEQVKLSLTEKEEEKLAYSAQFIKQKFAESL